MTQQTAITTSPTLCAGHQITLTAGPSLTTVTSPALPRGDPVQRVFLQRGLFGEQILQHMLVLRFVHPSHDVTRLPHRFLLHLQIVVFTLANAVVSGPATGKQACASRVGENKTYDSCKFIRFPNTSRSYAPPAVRQVEPSPCKSDAQWFNGSVRTNQAATSRSLS